MTATRPLPKLPLARLLPPPLAEEGVGKRQQSRIIGAAQLWLAGPADDAMRDMRFDVVLVVPGRVRHLQAAFDASR